MVLNFSRIPPKRIMGIGGILIAVLLAGTFTLLALPRFSPHAFAASLQQRAGTTCAGQPTMEHCNNQDPEIQGCAADAVTLQQTNIVENGMTIGHIERRWSLQCQSWWGRVFDARPGSLANMYIEVAGTILSASPTFVSNTYRILYSSMVFDATPTQTVPSITGSMEISSFITPPSAILPAITVPGTIH